jgi:short-subunit dehydrogenase
MQYIGTSTRFLTVMPGPIKTAMFKANKPVPFVLSPQKAAAYILKQTFKNKQEIVFPFFWKIFFKLLILLPAKIRARILKS